MIVHTVIKPNKICKERKQRKCRKQTQFCRKCRNIINEPGTKCEHQRKQTASEQGIMKSQQKKTPCGIKPTPILRENKAHQSFIPGKIACLLGHVEHITIYHGTKQPQQQKEQRIKLYVPQTKSFLCIRFRLLGFFQTFGGLEIFFAFVHIFKSFRKITKTLLILEKYAYISRKKHKASCKKYKALILK